MARFRLICTHNPQDFFNGIEPIDLSLICESDHLEDAVCNAIDGGYQVIITKAGDIDGRTIDLYQD